MKKLMLRAMVLCMVLCLLPSNIYGASAFEFSYLNDDPSTNHRTGIKSIVIDDKTYFDIYDGNPNGRTPPNNSYQFLKDILTKPDNSPKGDGATALDYWSQLAYRIFADNSSYTSHINPSYGGTFEQAFGRRGGATDGGYADLVQDLSSVNSGARWNTGHDSDDNTVWTGLAYADSLKDLRQRMANSVAKGIGRKITGADVLSGTDGGNGLKMLDVDYAGDVLYSMVTGVDKRGDPASWFYYNAFGLAFYDFQMSVIADNGLQYITAAEGYESVKDAADNMEPGVTYENIGNTSGVLSYYENGASVPSDVGMEFSQSNSTEISNSMTTTETYTFRETIGSETKFKATVPLLAEIEQTIKLEFSAEQAFSTAWTETKTVKQETTNTVSANLNLPAHSAVAIDSADGTVKVTLSYDCPIAITFKVAIFSLSGCCYDDNLYTRSFSTAGYWQKHFCTTFGNSTGDAQSEFYDRAVTFSKVEGYEETNGSTYGWGKSRTVGTTAITVNKLNWGSIIGNVQPEVLNVGYSRECYTVEPVKVGEDADGNDILVYVQKSPLEQLYADNRTDGVAGYDNQVSAPASIGALANYTLVTGDVFERVGVGLEPLDNDFPGVENTKVAYFYDNPAENVVKFYYVLTADAIPDPPQAPDSNSVFRALGVTFSTMVSKETLANWLGKHVPMSSAGGVLTYMSRSMSTKINSVLPLYPLKNIKLKEGVATEYS
ncbi:MAG: aerolysin family beta-barrel pore-forming toxin, partial [Clostridiales bacterium]|nr:aerolysin family beta-barrel pore-forming toxin [Clostridiales bacterium]